MRKAGEGAGMGQGTQIPIEQPAHIRIVAGPNGADKTTFAHQYLTREAPCRAGRQLFIRDHVIGSGLCAADSGMA
jgi:hypothetical protein